MYGRSVKNSYIATYIATYIAHRRTRPSPRMRCTAAARLLSASVPHARFPPTSRQTVLHFPCSMDAIVQHKGSASVSAPHRCGSLDMGRLPCHGQRRSPCHHSSATATAAACAASQPAATPVRLRFGLPAHEQPAYRNPYRHSLTLRRLVQLAHSFIRALRHAVVGACSLHERARLRHFADSFNSLTRSCAHFATQWWGACSLHERARL